MGYYRMQPASNGERSGKQLPDGELERILAAATTMVGGDEVVADRE
jgi:hypothetical protein